ncbi:MAG: hypothetical protein ABWY06_20010 [Pseudomonas sp.]|uniref:hypothetical protein n=1 Tax=Pseudomonas sp. TaxID=306 RepID=UPI00339478D0
MYIDTQTHEYPLFENDIRERASPSTLPSVLEPADVLALGYAPVLTTERPTVEPGQTLQEGPPVLAEGQWSQTWVVVTGPAPALDWRITPYAFLTRFADAERLAVRSQGKNDIVIEDFLALVGLTRFVDLQAVAVGNALDYLVGKGLITLQRRTQILSTPPVAAER